MQESVSMRKSPTPVRNSRMNQARPEEEEKETGKTEARRLMERKADQQNKNTSEELKQGLPKKAQLRLTKQGEERWTSPGHRMWPPAPTAEITRIKQLLINNNFPKYLFDQVTKEFGNKKQDNSNITGSQMLPNMTILAT